jgi:hypothetical protein
LLLKSWVLGSPANTFDLLYLPEVRYAAIAALVVRAGSGAIVWMR